MQFDRRFLLPLCATVTEGDKTGDVIRLSQDGDGSQVQSTFPKTRPSAQYGRRLLDRR